ncbi:MAG: hypothetical protein QOD70_1612 [Frankiales bacterium]|nr:hypothetical protein [Frankiales bacterium]
MAALHRDPSEGTAPTGPSDAADVLPPVSSLVRSRLGTAIAGIGLLAVVLTAVNTPAAVRAPVVLVAALLLPGYPLVARLRVDLPTLLAINVCTCLALEAGLAVLTVELRFWHPMGLALALAAFGVGGTFSVLMSLRHAEARHLR